MFPENTVRLTVTWDIRDKFIFVAVNAIKAYGEVAVQHHHWRYNTTSGDTIPPVVVQHHQFINSTLDGGEWTTSPPGRFTSVKEPSVPIE